MVTESKRQKFLQKIIKLGHLKDFQNPQNKWQFAISNEDLTHEKIKIQLDFSKGLDENGEWKLIFNSIAVYIGYSQPFTIINGINGNTPMTILESYLDAIIDYDEKYTKGEIENIIDQHIIERL